MVELHKMSALQARREMDAGHLSSAELVNALHARADRLQGRLNAFVSQQREAARATAAQRDVERARGAVRGPLHGLPLSIKDNLEVEGTAATLGMRARAGHRSTRDAVVVRLAREAGGVVLGKTNVPQSLIAMETVNALFGTTQNPWNTGRTPGGSSGGEAAAIASGMSMLGVGTDIGGSVRIPAAYCGIAALKPTLHRWSNTGSLGALPGQEFTRAQVGPLARCAADVAFFFRSLDPTLHARLDPETAPLPVNAPEALDLHGVRVGFYADDGFFTPARSVQRALVQARSALEAAGATLVPYAPPRSREHYKLLAAGLTADGMHTLSAALAGEPPVQPLGLNMRLGGLPRRVLRAMAQAAQLAGQVRLAETLDMMGQRQVHELWALNWTRTSLQREELAAWNQANLDALLCPATATPAPPHGSTADFTAAAVFTTRYNLLNLPAGVVPVTRARAEELERSVRVDRLDEKAAMIEAESMGLPVGVQLVGRPFREDMVLRLMMAVEDAARRGEDFPHTPVDL